MSRMDQADSLMRQAVADRVFPGGVLLVAQSGSIRFFKAYGLANIFTGRPMTCDTIFDLASLTKPLATTLTAMKLVQQNKLTIDQPVAEILPEFKNTDKAGIRIAHLLAHVSGLPDYRPYYHELCAHPLKNRKNMLLTLLQNEPLAYATGQKTIYSDLGFMLLYLLIEKIAGCSLDTFVTREVYQPLGIKDLFFIDVCDGPPESAFAATEDCRWRNRVLEGVVHDENAYALGGVSGHAGLFGTAEAVCALLLHLLQGTGGSPGLFAPALLRRFLSRYSPYERALGFDMPAETGSSAGEYFQRETSVGHLGFTGTSFWMAMDRSIIIMLLTNRIHPRRDNEAIRQFRPILHNALMARI